jgi:hypothetical protein
MAYDIVNGDILVVGSEQYPIRSVAFWGGYGRVGSISHLATVTASTKRSPAISGGKVGAPVTSVASLRCSPLDPVDPELRQRLSLETPHELLQTYVPDETGFFHLILEELKR